MIVFTLKIFMNAIPIKYLYLHLCNADTRVLTLVWTSIVYCFVCFLSSVLSGKLHNKKVKMGSFCFSHLLFQNHSRLLLRIAVDDSSSCYRLGLKFGAGLNTTCRLLEHAAELGLEVVGVSFHVGSLCGQSSAFRRAIADACHVFDTAVSDPRL